MHALLSDKTLHCTDTAFLNEDSKQQKKTIDMFVFLFIVRFAYTSIPKKKYDQLVHITEHDFRQKWPDRVQDDTTTTCLQEVRCVI